MMKFVGREFELSYLDRQYQDPSGSLCIVYGRRRIGKTRLITHWLETRNPPGFYWLATDTSAATLLRSLSRTVYEQEHGHPPPQPEFTYFDWDELFLETKRLVERQEQKLVIILDEFTYAIDAYPDLPYKLQATWDQHLKDKPVMLA